MNKLLLGKGQFKHVLLVILLMGLMIGLLTAQENQRTINPERGIAIEKYDIPTEGIWFGQDGLGPFSEGSERNVWFTHLKGDYASHDFFYGHPDWIPTHRFTPAQLIEKGVAGHVLTRVAIIVSSPAQSQAVAQNYRIQIRTGGSNTGGAMGTFNPGTLVLEQPFTPTFNSWTTVILDTQIPILSSQELWISWTADTNAAGNVGSIWAGYEDDPPALYGFGDVVFDGTTWTTLYAHEGGIYDDHWMIRGFAENQLDNDLSATSVTGPVTVNVNTTNSYSFRVDNLGANPANGYTVRLTQGTTQIGTQAGVNLTSGAFHLFNFNWTPNTTGLFPIHGEIVWGADENPANNQSPPLNVRVFPEGVLEVYVGDENSTTFNNTLPFSYWWGNNVGQTIYLDSEITATGLITDVTLRFRGEGLAHDTFPVRLYLHSGENVPDTFATSSSWIPFNNFTLVYEGTLPVNVTGIVDIMITLDTPFPYTGGNLAIMYHKLMQDDLSGSTTGWQTTATGTGRTLNLISDTTTYNPSVSLPAASSVQSLIFNASFIFSTSGLGTLSGVVSTSGNPLAGVTVSIDGSSNSAISDELGAYTISHIQPGTINITATKDLYQNAHETNISIVANQTTTRNISMSPTQNDIAALTITGNTMPTAQTMNIYQVTIRNMSASSIAGTAYNVRLRQVVTGGTDIVLASASGQTIAAGETMTLDVSWIPEYSGSMEIYGFADFPIDTNQDNNATEPITLDILEAGTAMVYIGDPTSTLNSTNAPFNYYWRRSIVQTIYLGEDINIGGLLTGVVYEYQGSTTPPPADIPFKMWVGTTDKNVFAANNAGEFVTYENFTLVWEGSLPTNVQGWHDIPIVFNTPFAYTGGNLVIMVQKPHWTGEIPNNNVWRHTASGGNRTLWLHTDGNPPPGVPDYDPELGIFTPGSFTLSPNNANITLMFSTSGLGSLAGTVTSGGTPLSGASVAVEGTNRVVETNAQGQYTISHLSANTYNVTASLLGYVSQTHSVTIIAEETITQNFSLEATDTVTVSGTIIASDTDLPVSGATVTLTGYAPFGPVTSNAQGVFTIPNVFANQSYTLTVTAMGYSISTHQLDVGSQDLNLGNVFVYELTYPPRNVVATIHASGNSVNVTWDAPFIPDPNAIEFTHITNQVWGGEFAYGGGAWGTAPGVTSAHRYSVAQLNALGISGGLLTKVSFHTGNFTGGTFEIRVWTGGSGGPSAIPIPGTLVHTQALTGVISSAWNEIELTEPVPIPTNAELWIGYNVYSSGNPAALTDLVNGGMHGYGNLTFIEGEWSNGVPGDPDIENWMIKGVASAPSGQEVVLSHIPHHSYDTEHRNLIISSNDKGGSEENITIIAGASKTNSSSAFRPFPTPFVNRQNISSDSRAFESYNIYRAPSGNHTDPSTWITINTGVTNLFINDPSWANLDGGLHRYIVTAVYSNNNESDPVFSNEIRHMPAGTVYIGNPSSTVTNITAPFDYWYRTSVTQTIYHASDITAGGLLTEVIYEFNGAGNITATDIELMLYIGETDQESFPTTTSWVDFENFTHVWSGILPVNVSGWVDMPIVLDTPYIYSGGNLVIMGVKPYASQIQNTNVWRNTSTPNQRTMFVRRDGSASDPPYDPANLPTASGRLESFPNITLIFSSEGMGTLTGTVTTGTPPAAVEGAVVSVDGSNRQGISGPDGVYTISFIPQGTISVTAKKDLYLDAQETNIQILENETSTRNITMLPRLNDLAAWDIFGSLTPTAQQENVYQVLVRNMSAQSIAGTAYNVRLMQVVEGGNNVQIATAQGLTIASAEILSINVIWTPTTSGAMQIYGFVDYTADINPADNNTEIMSVDVQPAGTAVVYIGNENSTTRSDEAPVNYYYHNSISQTIYHADEIPAGGMITRLEYDFNGASTHVVEGINVQFYLRSTEQTVFPTNASWVPWDDEWVLVYDAPLEVTTAGRYDVIVNLEEDFPFGGGNLVVMVVKNWTAWYSSNNNWQTTARPENRTIFARNDSGTGGHYNPATGYPTGQTPAGWIPNIRIFFDTSGMGHLSGTVTHATTGLPEAGVEIRLTGTNRRVFSDAQGQYFFNYVPEGNTNFTAIKHGFINNVFTAEIVENENTTHNIEMTPRPTVTVIGRIIGSDTQQGLPGANIILEGYDNYEVTSIANGTFSIANVYSGFTYTLTVTREGYDRLFDDLVEIGVTSPFDLGDITLYERAYPPRNVYASEVGANVVIEWEEPTATEDLWITHGGDGPLSGALGLTSGNAFVHLGMHRYTQAQLQALGVSGAQLSKVEFWANNNPASPGPGEGTFTIKAFTGGSGSPLNPGQEIYSQAIPANLIVWNAWNEINLTNPVTIPSSGEFWFGLEANVESGRIYGIGMSPTADTYGNIIFFNNAWNTLMSLADIENNWMLRGFVTGAVPPTIITQNPADEYFINRALELPQVNRNIDMSVKHTSTRAEMPRLTDRAEGITTMPEMSTTRSNARRGDVGNSLIGGNDDRHSRVSPIGSRVLEGFNVYRSVLDENGDVLDPSLWTVVALNVTGLTATDTTWGAITTGAYKYIVRAVYTNNNISAPALSNVVSKDMTSHVTINLITADQGPVNGAVVRLVNNSGDPNHIYQQTATSESVVFPAVWRGTYTLTVNLSDYEEYINNSLTIQSNPFVYDVVLLTSSILLEEGFESETFPPAGWVVHNLGPEDSHWMRWTGTSTALPHQGTAMAVSWSDNGGPVQPNNYLVTPPIILPSAIEEAELSFFRRPHGNPAWSSETYTVYVSTVGNAVANFTPETIEFTETISSYEPEWQERVVDLTGFVGQTIWIAFRHHDSYDNNYLALDTITVTSSGGVVAYFPPRNLRWLLLDGNEVKLDWEAPVMGTPDGFRIRRNGSVIATLLTALTYTDTGLLDGTYTYSVTAVYGEQESDPITSEPIDIISSIGDDPQIPVVTALTGNIPNPFNPSTMISFDLATDGHVKIDIFNIRGQKIKTLVDENLRSGKYSSEWMGDDDYGRTVSSGVYFYQMQTEDYSNIRRMVLLK
ncbi:MAG: carboxypeptidase regulatory-like domain-containing protein [Candidatus Cloacimonetes bacterium]|nr:carboxypeptidase regulatory-like domain-containing protein [Candidatus Cloacimonadota bacterium]